MTPAKDAPLDVLIITGMSGAGRSEAANVLEDLGFFVIDNRNYGNAGHVSNP